MKKREIISEDHSPASGCLRSASGRKWCGKCESGTDVLQ